MSVIVAKAWSYYAEPTPTLCLPAVPIQSLLAPSIQINADAITTDDWGSVKWLVVLALVDNTKIRSFEVHADHQYGINPSFTVYGILGDSFNHYINVQILSGQLTLQLTNNEATSAIAYITRVAVPLNLAAVSNLPGVVITQSHIGIAPFTSAIVDTFQCTGIHACKWILTITDSSDNKVTSQVFAVINSASLGSWVEYAFIGHTTLVYRVIVDASIGAIRLIVENDDISDLYVDVTRIPVQAVLPQSCPTIDPELGILIPNEVTIGSGSTSVVDIWVPNSVDIDAGSAIDVDTNITIPGHNAVKWLVYIRQPSTNTSGAFELMTSRNQLNVTDPIIYGIISTYFNITVTTSAVGLDMVLTIINNETSPLIINLIRIPVSL